jgi:hypothetical protein
MRPTVLIAAMATLLGLAPAAAAATRVDAASDHAALSAYHRYLRADMANLATWRRAADTYVASISARCPDVLAGLLSAPAGAINQTAVFKFGVEAGADLGLAGARSDRGAFGKLASALAGLPWSSPQTSRVIRSYLAAQRRLSDLPESDLCRDARALAAAHGETTSRRTARWVSRFVEDVTAQQRQLAAFTTILKQFQTPADNTLVSDTARLERRLSARLQAVTVAEAKKLIAALGLPS